MTALELFLVRHGESVGNVAANSARDSGADEIEVDVRDADVELTEAGVEQATGLGLWLAERPEQERPTEVWSSPFVRAQQTARVALDKSELDLPFTLDERLRDRDLGIFDLLTTQGVDARFPEEAERRRWLGKFYYRPPGGESWADLALRIRSVVADLERLAEGSRVLILCHDAIILTFRYVCEGLSESEIIEVSRSSGVSNASITHLSRSSLDKPWAMEAFDDAGHLRDKGAPVTEQPGA